jgi:hypothetical protein
MNMKSAFVMLSISLFLIFAGCKKDKEADTKPDCEVNQYGTITITNPTDVDYAVMITKSEYQYVPVVIKAGKKLENIHVTTMGDPEPEIYIFYGDNSVVFYTSACMHYDVVLEK